MTRKALTPEEKALREEAKKESTKSKEQSIAEVFSAGTKPLVYKENPFLGEVTFTPIVQSEWKSIPTVKTVHIHATSELIGMASTIRHNKCDIYEATDSSGRLLLISKEKGKRRIVLSQGNYKMYELL